MLIDVIKFELKNKKEEYIHIKLYENIIRIDATYSFDL